MAVTDAYATAAQYRAALGKTTTADDAEILTDLTAVSRYLEGKLNRFFTRDASDVTRVYEAELRSSRLVIDDLSAAPTSITVDTEIAGSFAGLTPLAAADYQMEPLNALLGPEAQPYTQIRLTSWGDYVRFEPGQRVQVVGRFGWVTVPSAIQRATIQLTGILRLETPRATGRMAELDDAFGMSREAQNIIGQLMGAYKRWELR